MNALLLRQPNTFQYLVPRTLYSQIPSTRLGSFSSYHFFPVNRSFRTNMKHVPTFSRKMSTALNRKSSLSGHVKLWLDPIPHKPFFASNFLTTRMNLTMHPSFSVPYAFFSTNPASPEGNNKPNEPKKWSWAWIKKVTIDGLKHTWHGFKLLAYEIRTCMSIIRRVLNGHTLTRREKRQLQKTFADLLRMIPFVFFIIIPFAEFTLPFFLWIWPNMLPSTFEDSMKKVFIFFFGDFDLIGFVGRSCVEKIKASNQSGKVSSGCVK